jgi:hypothetical protein
VYPQPVRKGKLNFYFQLPATAEVSVEIYNMAGEEVGTLREIHNAGAVHMAWTVGSMAPGVYLYRMRLYGSQGMTTGKLKKFAVVQ